MTNKQKYNLFVTAEKHLPIFAQTYWLNAVSNNWDVWYYTIDNLHFYLPFVIEKKGPFTFIRNLIATPYSSIYCSSPICTKTIWNKVYQQLYLDFCKFSLVELDQHFLLTSLQHHTKINTTQLHTNTIDTNESLEILKSKIKPSLQRHLKFAEKNISILACTDAEIIFNILESTAVYRKIKNNYSKPLLQNILNTCSKYNCGIAWQALDDTGKVQSVIIQVWDAHASYAVLSATLYPDNARGAMPALLWHAISHTKSLGIPCFDFEGSRVKGIDTFFKTFGTNETKIFQIKMENSKVAKVLLQMKKKLV